MKSKISSRVQSFLFPTTFVLALIALGLSVLGLSVLGLSVLGLSVLGISPGLSSNSKLQDGLSSVEADAPEHLAPRRFVQEPLHRSSFKPDFSARRASDPPLSRKRLSPRVLSAFSQAMGNNWKAAVRVMCNGEQVALGTIVDPDGWIITKASQLPGSSRILCRLFDYREFAAEIVTVLADVDLALLHVPADHLPIAVWADDLPNRGNWVATADLKETPSSVGVVSAGIQSIKRRQSVLGVSLTSSSEGAAVAHVLLGTGAYDAGLRVGDNIFEVNGIAVRSHKAFVDAIDSAIGGDLVKLKVSRASKQLEIEAQLMDLSDELLDDTEMEVNGRVSARATGFDRVFLHDTVLKPNQCGGPLVNLDGEVVGVNIARAGRVTSYALPYDIVQPVVNDLIAKAKLVSRKSENKPEPVAVQ